MATLLALARRVAKRIPLTSEPDVVVGSTQPGVKQLLEMFQEEGDELRSRHEWSVLKKQWSINVGASSPHEEDYPSDFDRLIAGASLWRSDLNSTPMNGPVSADQWYLLTALSGTYPGYWRRWENGIQILGVDDDATVTTEYVSKKWILDDDGTTAIAEWAADTDTPRLPDILFVRGVLWRWKQSKGLDYAEDMATYEREFARNVTLDTQLGTISLGGYDHDFDVGRRRTWNGLVTES